MIKMKLLDLRSKGIVRYILITLTITFYHCNKDDIQPPKHVAITDVTSSYTGSLFDVYFSDEQTGFIVGDYDFEIKRSIFLKTLDSGNNWTSNTFNIPSVRINGLTGSNGRLFALGTSQELGNSKPDQVYISNDSGMNWTYSPAFPYGYPLFFDDRRAILTTGDDIYYSADGAETWSKIFELNSMGRPNALQITGNNTVYIGGGASFDFTNFGFFYKSVDGGLTWQRNNKNFKNIVSMSFIDENTGYVFEDLHEGDLTSSLKEGTAIYKTNDGGITWKENDSHLNDAFPICHFFNETDGVYANLNSLFYTNDEGQTWLLQFRKHKAIMRKMYFINAHSALLVGDAGLILKMNVNSY